MANIENNYEPKKINVHHLYYVLLIAILIIAVLILHIPFGISKYALDNFSFASTITSIVLAVVSIVYSIQTGNSSSDQLNGVRDIERNITEQLNNFSELEGKLHKKVDEIRTGVTTVKEGQADIKKSVDDIMLQREVGAASKNGSKANNISVNSVLGNVLLYICVLSFETKLPIPGAILEKRHDIFSYCYGYLIALTVFEEDKIQIDTESDQALTTVVCHFDKQTFGTKEEIRARIDKDMQDKESVDKLKIILNEIDEYFRNYKEENVK